MRAKVVLAPEGDTVELPTELAATDVNRVNSKNLAVVVDDAVETTEYVRRQHRSRSPTRADMEIPDNAVVVSWDGDTIDFLEPQND